MEFVAKDSIKPDMRVIKDGELLECPHIVLFNTLIEQYTNFKPQSPYSWHQPDLIQAVPRNQDYIQIIYTPGHFVCCYYDTKKVFVYDSLNQKFLYKELAICVNRLFPHIDLRNLLFPEVQEQPNGVDCGVFAIAFTVSLLYNIKPDKVKYQHSSMRPHLIKLLETFKIEHFPQDMKYPIQKLVPLPVALERRKHSLLMQQARLRLKQHVRNTVPNKSMIERGDRVSLPIREPVPLNHQDKAYRPEFIPVEDDNLKSAANELQNDEPRRPFPHVEVQVKLEPVDIVQEECDAENGLDMETDPSNRKDEPYELTSVKCEVDEEILQRPEFIPVERDDDLESGATRLQTLRLNIEERVAIVIWQIQGKEYNEIKTEFERRFKKTGPLDKTVDYLLNKFRRTGSVHDEIKSEHLHTSKDNVNAVLSEASFSGEDDSDNSSSWGEDMIPAPGACVMFVRCNSAGDRVEGSEVLSENKLLRVLQKRRRGREGKRRCRKRHTPESEQRYLHRNQENINNTQEGISPEYQGKFVKEKQEREKRRKADEADHQRPKHEREKLRKADEQIWMRPEKKRIRLDVRGTTSGSVTCGESMNLEQS